MAGMMKEKEMDMMKQHGPGMDKDMMKKVCPEPTAPSMDMEDPINEKDPKSIEIGYCEPMWM